MSYSNLTLLKKLRGKNVLFIDTETIGLPLTKSNFGKPEERYYDYKINDKYNSSRIVEIGWKYIPDYDPKNKKNDKSIKSYIRKPIDFNSIPNSDFHGITYKNAKKNGTKMSAIMNSKLKNILKECDYIVGYSVYFDINILLNELNRLKFNKSVNIINDMIKTHKILCIAQVCSNHYEKIYPSFIKNFDYKIPSQKDLYEHLLDDNIDNCHRTTPDIRMLINITDHIMVKWCIK